MSDTPDETNDPTGWLFNTYTKADFDRKAQRLTTLKLPLPASFVDRVHESDRAGAERNGYYMACMDLLPVIYRAICALKEVEHHHVEQNRLKGRAEERSKTLRIVRDGITTSELAMSEGASPIEASSPEPSSARTTAESGTGVIAGDAQEQPTEGKHPSSKGIGQPPRYFTQEEVKAMLEQAEMVARIMGALHLDEQEAREMAASDFKSIAAKHGITDL